MGEGSWAASTSAPSHPGVYARSTPSGLLMVGCFRVVMGLVVGAGCIFHASARRPSLDTVPTEHEQFMYLLMPEATPIFGLEYMRPLHEQVPKNSSLQKTNLAGYTKRLLFDIGGGTGATIGGTGDKMLDQTLMRRMRSQDKAVMLLLLLAYTGSLAFSASLAYRQANNDSPITYYADPRYHNAAVERHDVAGFLQAFNQPPKNMQLQITGFTPSPDLPDYVVETAVEWLGVRYQVAFSFALDLSPWVVRKENIDDRTSVGSSVSNPAEVEIRAGTLGPAAVGVPTGDFQSLRDFLVHSTNDLAVVELHKKVEWPEWEELATNIKQQIRQSGFTGTISVHNCMEERVTVYKNRPWANFMHNRTTRVICALSIVGWFIYQPYMWLRHWPLVIHSHYCINVEIGNYWPLIADKIGAEGFDTGGAQPTF